MFPFLQVKSDVFRKGFKFSLFYALLLQNEVSTKREFSLVTVACLPALSVTTFCKLGMGYMSFPRLASFTISPRLTWVMFSRAWHRLRVFPRLPTVACFSACMFLLWALIGSFFCAVYFDWAEVIYFLLLYNGHYKTALNEYLIHCRIWRVSCGIWAN